VALAFDLDGGWNALYRGGDKLLPSRVNVPCVGGLWKTVLPFKSTLRKSKLFTVLVQFERLIKANKDSSLLDHGRQTTLNPSISSSKGQERERVS
jgi:hypothetical protein